MKTLPIAFASDDKGVLLLGISLYSLLISKNSDTKYRIYILDDNISIENQNKIKSLQDSFDCEIIFIPIHHLLEQHISKSYPQWPATTFGRMFLPSLISNEDFILYIDIDTLILKDLSPIQDIDLDNNLVGVVYQANNKQSTEWKTRLSIPQRYGYFNAGVLYMNLQLMRNEDCENQFLSYLQDNLNILNCPDQDILNATLYKRSKSLEPCWNWPTSQTRKILFHTGKNLNGWGNMRREAMVEAATSPYIIHFIGSPKPINYNYKFHNKLYREIWLKSPWRDIPMTGKKRIKYFFRRMCYLPFDYFVKMKISFLQSKLWME